jgi:hypothetical protein
VAAAPRCGGEAVAARLGEGTAMGHAWQGRQPSAAPGRGIGQALHLGGDRSCRSAHGWWRTLRVPRAWSSRWPLPLERIGASRRAGRSDWTRGFFLERLLSG